MANTLGYYNPVFYAQEALIQLEMALGMASRVHRGYEAERRGYGRGEYVNIRRPSTFTAEDAPDDGGQNLTAESVQVQLAYWREAKFVLTDKELAFTGNQIISEHIRPAAYALATDIDDKLCDLYLHVPWYVDFSTVATAALCLEARQRLVLNNAPMNDDNIPMMVDPYHEADLLALDVFAGANEGGSSGEQALQSGHIGKRWGMEFFTNQNVPTLTASTLADVAGEVDGAHAAGVTEMTIDALTDAETVVIGDIFTIAGDTQSYVVRSADTVSGNEITVTTAPALKVACTGGEVVTFAVAANVAGTQGMAFHKNAFALVTAPLPEMGNELGAKVATVTDPLTGLSLRSRIYYIGNSSAVHVALDVLYGVQILDHNLAVRCCGNGA